MYGEFMRSLTTASSAKEKADVVKKYSQLLGLAAGTLYRHARNNGGGDMNRMPRSDNGGSRKLSVEQIKKAGALIAASRRRNGKMIMDAGTAKEILEDSGMLNESVSVDTLRRQLRNHQVSARHAKLPAPHKKLTAEHPNQWHLFDVSVCVMYFLDSKKGLTDRFKEDESQVLYAGKLKNFKKIKKHLLRYLVCDKHSGSFFAMYFYNSGETALDTAHFFYEAWRQKQDSRFIFHGVPENLYMDRGSMADNAMVKGLMKSLRVNALTHMPGNPRAKGGVETIHRWWEVKFESRLGQQRPRSLEELNGWAFDMAVRWNAKTKFRKSDISRAEIFSTITAEQLRILPEWNVYQTLLRARPETRTVRNDLIIEFHGAQYHLADPSLNGQKVQVSYNPYSYPTVEVLSENGTTYVADPLPENDHAGQQRGPQVVQMGSFKPYSDNATTKAKKAGFKWLSEIQGTSVSGKGDKQRILPPTAGHEGALKLFGHQADKVGNLAFVPKKGKAIEIGKKKSPVLGLTTAMLEIADALGRPLTHTENAALSEKYPAGIPAKKIDSIIERLEKNAPGSGRGAEKYTG